MTLQKRLSKLEAQQHAHDENLFARLAWVIDNPREAAAAIGADALARIHEILATARARKEKANE